MLALRFLAVACLGGVALAPTLTAQQVTAADYARAERFLAAATTPLVTGGAGRPTWLRGERFWYRKATGGSGEFLLVTPAARRVERVLWNDPATGVMRHADAGYDIAIDCAREHKLDLPFLE